jgi:uncharacterized protein (UPF0254 family)
MRTTDSFKKTILSYLKFRAFQDQLFAESLKKENKNIDECVDYILNQVQSSGINGFEDKEIFAMAVHYYDEDNIEIDGMFSGSVVVNHKIELTEEEIKELKKQARQEVIDLEKSKMLKKAVKVKTGSKIKNKTLFS